jgi:predicted hotdog family 3-hydroxylacyl-ACP dehydratase
VKPCPFPLQDLLPHAPPMVLLDEAVSWTTDAMVTAVTVRPGGFFFRPGHGIPAHVAIEWMAQTCGAFVGAEAVAVGQAVRIGYLLGTRDFVAHVPWFPEGMRLEVMARLVFSDQEMGVFDCLVGTAERSEPLATARLTVYQPPDSDMANAGPAGVKDEDAS